MDLGQNPITIDCHCDFINPIFKRNLKLLNFYFHQSTQLK
jgi:hypothetical protein